jgi:N-acetyl sugar amidotransferase
MDTSDPEITFDADGVCSHCRYFDEVTSKQWFPNAEGNRLLQAKLGEIKRAGAGQDYDCILGLSGGVDSSYLALKAKDWGLRPLVVHVDAGWNSELAVSNIESLVRHCNYDLHTIVIDWDEMRDLQLAFLKSGLSNQDTPQDHAFFASLYRYAVKNKIRYILSGGNIATESILPKSWHNSAMDGKLIQDIHKKFGTIPLKTFPIIGFWKYYFWYPVIRGMRTFRPLNFMPYDKAEAMAVLEQETGWRSYGRKHGESRFTKFFQNYYLPTKFGYDKRRPHLSSLIVAGQMTREAAVTELEKPLYDPEELKADEYFLCKKLRLTEAQFQELLHARNRDYTEFANWDRQKAAMGKIRRLLQRLSGKQIKVYY